MRATIISLLCFVCAGSQLQAQPGYYSFQHLGTGNGLSDGRINSIAQDKYGFIWIATNHGLNKFNGYTVETFGTNSLDSNSVPEIIIKDLLLVKSGRLFIATQNGLCEYNYATNSFKRYPFGLNFSIGKMIEVSPGIIWMHSAMGILIVDENKGSYTRLVDHKQRHLHSLAARYVHDFATNDKGQLFIGPTFGSIAKQVVMYKPVFLQIKFIQ